MTRVMWTLCLASLNQRITGRRETRQMFAEQTTLQLLVAADEYRLSQDDMGLHLMSFPDRFHQVFLETTYWRLNLNCECSEYYTSTCNNLFRICKASGRHSGNANEAAFEGDKFWTPRYVSRLPDVSLWVVKFLERMQLKHR